MWLLWSCARMKQYNWQILNLLALAWLEASGTPNGTNCLWLMQAYFCVAADLGVPIHAQPWICVCWARECDAPRAWKVTVICRCGRCFTATFLPWCLRSARIDDGREERRAWKKKKKIQAAKAGEACQVEKWQIGEEEWVTEKIEKC